MRSISSTKQGSHLIEAFRAVIEKSLTDSRFHSHVRLLFLTLEALNSWVMQFKRQLCSAEEAPILHEKKKDKNAPKKLQDEWKKMKQEYEQQYTYFKAQSHKYIAVQEVLKSISLESLTKAAIACNSYTRALNYYEQHVRQMHFEPKSYLPIQAKIDKLNCENIRVLQELYRDIEDSDSLLGISAIRKTATLDEIVIDYEAAGNWTEALNCYESKLQDNPKDAASHINALLCNRHLGHLQTIIRSVDGIDHRIQNNPHMQQERAQIQAKGAEAAWRLCSWDILKGYLDNCKESSDFEIGLAKCLLAYKNFDKDTLTKELKSMRLNIAGPLHAAGTDAYDRIIPHIVKLQMLGELEQSYQFFDKNETAFTQSTVMNMVDRYRKRLDTTKKIFKTSFKISVHEPLLSLRRVIFTIHELERDVAKSWLFWAKVTRKAQFFQTASSALLQAEKHKLTELYLEKAKWKFQTGSKMEALSVLEFASTIPDMPKDISAKMMLQAANYKNELRLTKMDTVLNEYENITKQSPNSEKAWFFLAKFRDACMQNALVDMNTMEHQKLNKEAVNIKEHAERVAANTLQLYQMNAANILTEYCESIAHGTTFLSQSLPRFLTLWFEVTAAVSEASNVPAAGSQTKKEPTKKKQPKSVSDKLNDIIEKRIEELPTYVWYLALSQLVSRIGHANKAVVETVKRIILHTVSKFPLQSLWHVRFLLKFNLK